MAASTSKLDSLSREDVIRFAKKQLVNGKELKEELAKVRDKLVNAEKRENNVSQQLKNVESDNVRLSRKIEELETKQSFLIEASTEESNEATTTELVLKARVTELEEELKGVEVLKNNNVRLAMDVDSLKKNIDSLEKQLKNSEAELLSLREQQSTADVFSLEVEDYARKVLALEKDLSAVKLVATTHENEVATLKTQLEEARNSQSVTDDDRRKFQQEAQSLRNQLCEAQVSNSQLKSEISTLNDQLNGLMENQGSERLGLGREIAVSQQRIAALEEVSEALREENVRLRAEHATTETRIKELEAEYENFKSRARFVLEQKTAKSSEEEIAKDKNEELEATIAHLKENLEMTKKDLVSKHDDCEKFKEKTTAALADLDTKRKEADELQTSLSSSMDELRMYRIKFENVVSQLTETSQRLSEADNEKSTLRQEILKSDALLKFERNRFEESLEALNYQIADEKKKREELAALLDESRREQKTVRVPPVAAVQPHICEYDYGVEQRRPSPDNTFNQTTQEDRSLEDVLFGEENFDDYIKMPTVENIPQLIEEINMLRKQAEHTTSLLNESEAANGRLTEQTRCLKDEIRRLERNEERKSHLENIEYLKNVIVKFLTPEKVAAEKHQLIPILNTMLRLSEEELQIVQRAAHSDTDVPSNASWGSYFKWGGMS